jgi:hypothetical protein
VASREAAQPPDPRTSDFAPRQGCKRWRPCRGANDPQRIFRWPRRSRGLPPATLCRAARMLKRFDYDLDAFCICRHLKKSVTLEPRRPSSQRKVS